MKVTLHGGPWDTLEVEVPDDARMIRLCSDFTTKIRFYDVPISADYKQQHVVPIARYEPREIVAEFDPVNGGFTKQTMWTFVGYEK